MSAPSAGHLPVGRIFLRFLRFGFLAWGGPVAQIGMIKRELVDEERWIEPARFNRLLAVYQVLPGPEAHELCVHLGMLRGGRIGGFLAGLGFMLPGLLLILALSWFYARLDLSAPPLSAVILAVQAAVVAIVVRAVHRIGEHVLIDRNLWLIAFIAAVAALAGVPFWVSLPAAGAAYALLNAGRRGLAIAVILAASLAGALFATGGVLRGEGTVELAESATEQAGPILLFLTGLKAGLLTFGGAYTAIPFVRDDAVGRGWVSDGQFLDGLALSGIIPAPLIIFASFVGYLAGGLSGALAITAGIFLPAFSFGLLFHDRLERVVEDRRLGTLLAGVAAGVVSLIAVTTLELGYHVARSSPTITSAVVFIASLTMLYFWRSKLALPAVVIGSALAGLASGIVGQ